MGTPKANRFHIALFGRTNVGKSSVLNLLCGQNVSIISAVRGTTTDVVEKAMELPPVGPVLFLDTGGLDDTSELAAKRVERTNAVFARADAVALVLEAGAWTEHEAAALARARAEAIPAFAVINKADLAAADTAFKDRLASYDLAFCELSSVATPRPEALAAFTETLLAAVPADRFSDPPLLSDLIGPGDIVILVTPIDLEAPKGRMILPQVQAIRDALDAEAVCAVVKEKALPFLLEQLRTPPRLVVCDSQVVRNVSADVPKPIRMTTFSTLFSRYKGDLRELAAGATRLDSLTKDSRVLIAEACTHHPIGDDIGRAKIPRWLRQYLGFDVRIDHAAGQDFPDDLGVYDLVIHCGACLLNRRHMLWRIREARKRGVAITNYGIAISKLQGVLPRILEPFGL